MKKTTTKTSATIGLYIRTERDRNYGDYFHVRAFPIIIGPTPYQLSNSQDSGARFNRSDEISGPDNDYGKRINGLYLAGLRINSQGNSNDTPRYLYGWDYDYRDLYSIDKSTAIGMAHTLTTIEKRTDALIEKYGRPATFGAYVLRVADAIGASRIVLPTKYNHSQSWSGDNNITDLQNGGWWIDNTVKDWTDELERLAEERRQADARRLAETPDADAISA